MGESAAAAGVAQAFGARVDHMPSAPISAMPLLLDVSSAAPAVHA